MSPISYTQAEIKAKQREFTRQSTYVCMDSIWKPTREVRKGDLLASSCQWDEGLPIQINEEISIAYGGGIAKADPGIVYIDLDARVLVGWHGSTQVPRGMGGLPLVCSVRASDPISFDQLEAKRIEKHAPRETYARQVILRKEKDKPARKFKRANLKFGPNDLFRLSSEYEGMFSAFDTETGTPTHDANWAPLSDSEVLRCKSIRFQHILDLASWQEELEYDTDSE